MKYIYTFGNGQAEGKAELKNLLGGKGANLAEMSRIGLPVPAGFTVTTEICTQWMQEKKMPEDLEQQLEQSVAWIEKAMDSKLGDLENPLLLSVRSGARVSMPGMMDTVLNLGLNREVVSGFVASSGNPRFVYDNYRRFLQMFGDVVLGIRPENEEAEDPFEQILNLKKRAKGVQTDAELDAQDLESIATSFEQLIHEKTGKPVPSSPMEQLKMSVQAVFDSWNNPRANSYREINGFPHTWGTAVNVQAMVYGNRDSRCGSGVAFSRNPVTGSNRVYGEYLPFAQGEDVVAGIRTPMPLYKEQKHEKNEHLLALEEDSPQHLEELIAYCRQLENHFKEMQDVEFTIENQKLWMLQTRTGKRTGLAAIQIATDLAEEGVISRQQALLRLEPENHLNQLLQPVFDVQSRKEAVLAGRVVGKGLAAGPGAATGRMVFSSQEAEKRALLGEKVILARFETSPEDIRGMAKAQGILTARGGATSHAALVARQMGKVCIVGCSDLHIDFESKTCKIGTRLFHEGDFLSLDGFSGEILEGVIDTQDSDVLQILVKKTLQPENSTIYALFAKVMEWSQKEKACSVRTNTERAEQAAIAKALGAEGIGLCRTEHMFFEEDRINSMRKMILAESIEERLEALQLLQPLQESDFGKLFQEMDGFPVTIRLLDPPLHEFLPPKEDLDSFAKALNLPLERLKERVETLYESNPMLGHRGCRLSVTYPEIMEMQVRAILRAACKAQKKGISIHPEIMIPFVGFENELSSLRKKIEEVATHVFTEEGMEVEYSIGTMIELPRACLIADRLAKHADFFSFGTNDLTQTTLGLSRDDSSSFLPFYQKQEIIDSNPFQKLDREGVGKLIEIAREKAMTVRPSLKMGVCGEHGGETSSIFFCHQAGLDYVSCSALRVPIAILSAAQANILHPR